MVGGWGEWDSDKLVTCPPQTSLHARLYIMCNFFFTDISITYIYIYIINVKLCTHDTVIMLNYTYTRVHILCVNYYYIIRASFHSPTSAAAVCRNSHRRLPPITASRVAHVVRRFFSHNNIIMSCIHHNNIIIIRIAVHARSM